MSTPEPFKRVSEPSGGGFVAWQVAGCCNCGASERIRDSKAASLPPEVVAKKLRAKGWIVGLRRSGDRCPACVRRPIGSDLSPGQRRAAWCRIEGVPRASENREIGMRPNDPVGSAPTPGVRQPTAAEKRRIRDELDALYDEAAGVYREAWSDKAMAAKIDLPRAWVADLREAMGLGPDRNEAAEQRSAEFEQVRALVADAQALALQAIEKSDEAERRLKKLGVDDAYARAV